VENGGKTYRDIIKKNPAIKTLSDVKLTYDDDHCTGTHDRFGIKIALLITKI